MAIRQDLENDVDTTLAKTWNIRDGQVVPQTKNVLLAGGAVKLAATILYADLADSTRLAMTKDKRVTSKVYKSFLQCAARLIRSEKGHIRSFDGDRVMGVFIGDSKNTQAAKVALKINWAFLNIIRPKLLAKYPTLDDGTWAFAHCVGVDTSECLVVRGGVRDNSDLVWIGQAPNVAAKLCSIREVRFHSYVTKAVYNGMNDEVKYTTVKGTRQAMWEPRTWKKVEGVGDIYRSLWSWPV